MKNYLKALRNFANIKGRMARHEFLQFLLLNFVFLHLIAFLAAILSFIVFLSFDLLHTYFSIVYLLVLLVPTVTAMVRRIHDTGRSAKWLLPLSFLAMVGAFFTLVTLLLDKERDEIFVQVITLLFFVSLIIIGILIIILLEKGNRGANKYGPEPIDAELEEIERKR